MKKIYNYDEQTGEFISESDARLNPLESTEDNLVYLLPRNATFTAPSKTATTNQAEIWDGSAWVIVPDYRGQVFFDAQGTEHKIDAINIKPDSTWTKTRPFILSEAQEEKRGQIREAFHNAVSQPVTDASGNVWNGGYDSALKLDAAKRMAELAGQTSVTFFDINNTAKNLTIAEAVSVILTIGADYQAKFGNKQVLMSRVDVAQTRQDIDAITVTI